MSIIDSMPIIQVAGIATNYEQIGSGPVLVMLHGWANSWEAWLPIIPHLSDHFTLIMPDLPGCGKTESPETGWSTAQHAKWLEHFLHELSSTNEKLSATAYIGHSYGGKMLLEFCSGPYEPQTKKIVLIDSSGIPAILNKKQLSLSRLASLTPRFIKDRLHANVRSKIYEEFGADSDYLTANEFQKKSLQLVLIEDYTQKLASIGQKTLLLWGKQDSATALWQGETMHQLIPLNELKTFESEHFPHHTYPKEVSDAIIAFLQ